ncbi:hypothetical protein FOA52_011921 [Chlamydomonas sp. UWO 241]|nr:hypothetical protein FOA52_011921 [Chlamydomonas sp. UWO 241]
MTAEEEAAYTAVLDARRARKESERGEYKRRARFDPLAGRKVAAPDGPGESRAASVSGSDAAGNSSQGRAGAATPKAGPRPTAGTPSAAAPAQQQQQPQAPKRRQAAADGAGTPMQEPAWAALRDMPLSGRRGGASMFGADDDEVTSAAFSEAAAALQQQQSAGGMPSQARGQAKSLLPSGRRAGASMFGADDEEVTNSAFSGAAAALKQQQLEAAGLAGGTGVDEEVEDEDDLAFAGSARRFLAGGREAAFEAAALRFLAEATEADEVVSDQTAKPRAQTPAARAPPTSPAAAARSPAAPARRRTLPVPGTFKPAGASGSPGALRVGPSSPSVPAPARAAARQQRRVAGPGSAARAAESVAVDRLAGELNELGMTTEQIAAALADDDDALPDGDEAEELDWDTLKAGESFERYLEELQQEEEDARVRRERTERAAAASPAAAAARAPARGTGAEVDEDAQMESLLRFLEMVEKGGGDASAAGRRRAVSGGGGGDDDGGEEDIDWGSLESMFLGEGWDEEIKDMAREATRAAASRGEDGSGSDGDANADDGPGWADEVTTLLLGLVGISHEHYLASTLLKEDPSEEERASVYWKAPFALIVQDDSKRGMLEYANETALTLLGYEYDDIYELSSFDIVDASDEAQQEWLWSTSEVEEKIAKHTVVPQLRLRGAGGRAVIAKDVLLFRIDNLEGQLIGQAIVAREWIKS